MATTDVERVKERTDILDVLKGYIDLRPAGKNYKALCPFHQEKTPSFMVSPERRMWHCFGCFPPGQKVKTPFGLHNIEDIDENHYVYSGSGKVRRVLATHVRNYVGDLVHVRTRKLNETVSMTADHKLKVLRPATSYRKKTKQFYRLCRDAVSRGTARTLSEAARQHGSIIEINAGSIAPADFVFYPIENSVAELTRIDLNDYLTKGYTFGPHSRDISLNIALDDDFLRLLGYWIAEGSSHRAYIRFSLGNHEREFADDIVRLVKNVFGLEAKIYERNPNKTKKTGLEITACHAQLANIFENLCGKGAEYKHIPFVFQVLPPEKQKVLVDAIFRGDGHTGIFSRSTKTHKSITSISRILAEQVIDILLRNNLFPSFGVRGTRHDARGVNHREVYRILWSEEAKSQHSFIYEEVEGRRYWLLPVKEVWKEPYTGPVYNLTVDEDHSYVANHFAVANCGQGGDVIKFVMLYEGIEFPEALQLLAERAGIELSRGRGGMEHRFAELYEVNELARDFFRSKLKENAETIAYLKGRGLTGETAKRFELGYAPGGDALTVYLLHKGHSIETLVQAGFAVKRGGLYKDFFANRVMFPLWNNIGRVVGFAGRVLADDDNNPKYVNSPETPIFQKSKLLYGFSQAKRDIAQQKSVFVMEGYMDALMAHQAGVTNAVAVCGTSLTPAHLTALRRLTDTAVVSFDSDEAGIEALERSLELLGTFDFYVKAVDLGTFKDPAEFVERDAEGFAKRVAQAEPAFKRLFAVRFGGTLDPAARKRMVGTMLRLISRLESAVEQDMWLKELSRAAGISEQMLREAFATVKAGGPAPVEAETPQEAEVKRIDRIARRLLTVAFSDDSFYAEVESEQDLLPEHYQDILLRRTAEGGLLELEASYLFNNVPHEELADELKELMRQLRIEMLKVKQKEIKSRIASVIGEAERERLLKQFSELSGELDTLRTNG